MSDRPTATGHAILSETRRIQEQIADVEKRVRHCEALLEQLVAVQRYDAAKLNSIAGMLRQLSADIHQTSRAAVELAAGDPAHTTDP